LLSRVVVATGNLRKGPSVLFPALQGEFRAIYKTNRGEWDKMCMGFMEKRAKVFYPTPLSIGLNG